MTGGISIAWTVSALKTAYQNREHIMGWWDTALAKTLGPKYRIAIVGPGGVGKSVLLDHITGKAFKQGYKLPARSVSSESGAAKSDGNRLAITVAPGQDGGPRIDTYNEIFNEDAPVDGIVFVTGFGFETLRSAAKDLEVSRGLDTLEKFRIAKLKLELKDLEVVLRRLRPTLRKARKPSWMLVATTKCDLYQDKIQAAEDYYAPYKNSPFSDMLHDFQSRVGTDNFEWDSLPVCSYLSDFEWNGEIAESTLTTQQRDGYIGQMIERMGELCR